MMEIYNAIPTFLRRRPTSTETCSLVLRHIKWSMSEDSIGPVRVSDSDFDLQAFTPRVTPSRCKPSVFKSLKFQLNKQNQNLPHECTVVIFATTFNLNCHTRLSIPPMLGC